MKIILVDDAPFIRVICRHHLENAGHEIIGEAEDGEEALALIDQMNPDVVVLDMALPSKSGIEIIEQVHKKDPGLPFIVLSALDEIDVRSLNKEIDYYCYLRKPFDHEALLHAVSELADSYSRVSNG